MDSWALFKEAYKLKGHFFSNLLEDLNQVPKEAPKFLGPKMYRDQDSDKKNFF